MRLALLGTRGVPANYGGFETCAEQLGQRLAERGHQVIVYCRSHHISYSQPTYKGMRLVRLPTIPNKYLDTILHTFISALHALIQNYAVCYFFGAGNSPVTWLPRLVGTKTILNVDGLDWRREKWPILAKRYIQFAEYLATKLPNLSITDSRVVQAYYQDQFDYSPPCIAYGADVQRRPPGETLAHYALQPQQYILFVGRLVPENGIHHLLDAFGGLDTDCRCVVVGDAPYAEEYVACLKRKAREDPRVIMTGYLFGDGYLELGSSALIFVETSGASGTHPALLEAMALGNCVVVNNTPENLETIGDAGLGYDGLQGGADLQRVLSALLENPERIQEFRLKARRRVQQHYQWESVTDDYERLAYQLARQPLPWRLHRKQAEQQVCVAQGEVRADSLDPS
jgi:glycosyltransferase involved in cell wall biosynthesis